MRYTIAEFEAFAVAAAKRQQRERLARLLDMRAASQYDADTFQKHFKGLNERQ